MVWLCLKKQTCEIYNFISIDFNGTKERKKNAKFKCYITNIKSRDEMFHSPYICTEERSQTTALKNAVSVTQNLLVLDVHTKTYTLHTHT